MTPNEAFKNYLESLPYVDRLLKMQEIKRVCKKTPTVISSWKNGRTKIDIAWQDKITQAIGENIFTNTEY